MYDHPLLMDLHPQLVTSAASGKPPLDVHILPRDAHWQRLLHSLIAEMKPAIIASFVRFVTAFRSPAWCISVVKMTICAIFIVICVKASGTLRRINALRVVKAESCGDCGTGLKLFYQQKNPAVEPVADDLTTLVLDARMEQEGFTRSSLNPFNFQVNNFSGD